MKAWEAAVEVLKETDNPAVMWGDGSLLHMIAAKLGWKHEAMKTERRVLNALSRNPGLLVPSLVRGHRILRVFRLPESFIKQHGLAKWRVSQTSFCAAWN